MPSPIRQGRTFTCAPTIPCSRWVPAMPRDAMTDYDRFLSTTGRQLTESAIRRMGTVVARATKDLVSFAPGYPAPELFPWDDLRAISSDLLNGSDPDTLQYGPTRGYRPLLESIVDILRERAISASVDDVLITSGSQ